MSKENPTAMAREILANAAAEFDKAASACENQADYFRQTAELLRRHDMTNALDMNDRVNPLGRKGTEAVEKAADFLRMLEVADKEYYEFHREQDLRRHTDKMSVDEARLTLMTHQYSCRDNDKCEVHKMLLARIRRG